MVLDLLLEKGPRRMMRVCDLQTGTIQLSKASKKLNDQWEETKPFWTDQKALDFDQDYLQQLSPQITVTLAAINRFAELLKKVERDCWDDDRLE